MLIYISLYKQKQKKYTFKSHIKTNKADDEVNESMTTEILFKPQQ
jgi:hypothetical protein